MQTNSRKQYACAKKDEKQLKRFVRLRERLAIYYYGLQEMPFGEIGPRKTISMDKN
jgi:hypothetical protein